MDKWNDLEVGKRVRLLAVSRDENRTVWEEGVDPPPGTEGDLVALTDRESEYTEEPLASVVWDDHESWDIPGDSNPDDVSAGWLEPVATFNLCCECENRCPEDDYLCGNCRN